MTSPLANLNVLDFTTLLPGPCATMILADMGANVLRVESPDRIDLLRVIPPMAGKTSASHAYLNRSKRSLALDLKKEGSVDVVKALVSKYDIVIEQFRPGVMDRLGVGYESLREINPGLIYCSVTGYGQTGPYRLRPGHDINYLALSGISSYSGRKVGGPSPAGIQIADVAGGSHHAVMGILASVIKRLQTGEGDYIDISMCNAALSMNHMAMAGFLTNSENPGWESMTLNGAAGYDYFETADGRYLSVGALEPQFVQNLCNVLGLAGKAPLFLSPRPEHQKEVRALLSGCFKQKTLNEWISVFDSVEACVEPVLNFSEVVEHPQFKDRAFCEVSDENGAVQKQLSSPLKFSSSESQPAFTGTEIGKHTKEILDELNFAPEQIEKLTAAGVFGSVDNFRVKTSTH